MEEKLLGGAKLQQRNQLGKLSKESGQGTRTRIKRCKYKEKACSERYLGSKMKEHERFGMYVEWCSQRGQKANCDLEAGQKDNTRERAGCITQRCVCAHRETGDRRRKDHEFGSKI